MQQAASPLDGLVDAQNEAYVFQRPNPGIHFSPTAGARYGMQQGCVPHVMTGRPAREFFQTAAISRGPKVDGQHTVTNAVTLKEEANDACTLIVTRGDPDELRAEMLTVFTQAGAVSEVRSDSGPGSSDSNGSFRQELHCLTLNGRPLFLLMASSTARNRPRLMVSLGPDPNGACRTR
ncbi:hypothetical protein [Brevundimonas sp.]|uniref:hypothetical protein n=1 Tax=Brevundimonas sp. TaxID=1871086 RepID=UPI00289D91FA|nr:hypothetical protein [Brevundimonas sp.]